MKSPVQRFSTGVTDPYCPKTQETVKMKLICNSRSHKTLKNLTKTRKQGIHKEKVYLQKC